MTTAFFNDTRFAQIAANTDTLADAAQTMLAVAAAIGASLFVLGTLASAYFGG